MNFFKKRGVAVALTAIIIVLMTLVGILKAPVDLPEVEIGTWVYDGADVLSLEQEDYLVQGNAALLSDHGAVIAVATVPSAKGWDLLDFAVELADRWELKGSDFILVLDIDGDNYWLVQGYDLLNSFPDSLAGQYLRQFLENDFAAGDYGEGAINLFDSLRYWYDSNSVPQYEYDYSDEYLGFYDGEPVEDNGGSGFGSALLLIIVAVLVIVALDGVRYNSHRRRRPSVAYVPLFFGRPHRPRRSAPPQPPPPRPNSGGFFGSSRPASRPTNTYRPTANSRPTSFTRPTRPSGSGRTSSGSFGGGRTGSFGAGRSSGRSGGSFGGGRSGAGRSGGGRRR